MPGLGWPIESAFTPMRWPGDSFGEGVKQMTDEERFKRFQPAISLVSQLQRHRHRNYKIVLKAISANTDSIIKELSQLTENQLESMYPTIALLLFGGTWQSVIENPDAYNPALFKKIFGKDINRQIVLAVALNLAEISLDQMLNGHDEEFLKRAKSYVHIAWIMAAKALGGAEKNKIAAHAARPLKRLDAKPGVIAVTDIEEEGEALRLRGVARADAVKKLAEEHRVTLQHVRRQLSQNGWAGRKRKEERTSG